MAKAPALGRGLGALITPKQKSTATNPIPKTKIETTEPGGEHVRSVSVGLITSSPQQPRTEFREEHLAELVASIQEQGIIQPLIVRKVGEKYELIAGERRWRASQKAGLKEVPIIERKASDQEVLELALIENLQREDLNPIEEAKAYLRLGEEFSMTQEQISKKVGKSRAAVANALRLLDLDSEVQTWLRKGQISVGHAKVLLGVKVPAEQRYLAEQIIRQAASVRATEKLVNAHLAKANSSQEKSVNHSGGGNTKARLTPALQRIENKLQQKFSTRVSIKHGQKTGSIAIEYYGSDDLDRLLKEFGVEID
ncbi:MAG: ParB/RepB/Spo0J family partition protein [Chthoniobacterales bacterium]